MRKEPPSTSLHTCIINRCQLSTKPYPAVKTLSTCGAFNKWSVYQRGDTWHWRLRLPSHSQLGGTEECTLFSFLFQICSLFLLNQYIKPYGLLNWDFFCTFVDVIGKICGTAPTRGTSVNCTSAIESQRPWSLDRTTFSTVYFHTWAEIICFPQTWAHFHQDVLMSPSLITEEELNVHLRVHTSHAAKDLRMKMMMKMATMQPEASFKIQLRLEHLEWHFGHSYWKQGDRSSTYKTPPPPRTHVYEAVDGHHHSWVRSSTHLWVTLEQINKTILTARRQMRFGLVHFFPSSFL